MYVKMAHCVLYIKNKMKSLSYDARKNRNLVIICYGMR